MTKPVVGMRCFTSHQRREMRQALIEKYGTVCQICKANGKPRHLSNINMALVDDQYSFSFDHIIPLADGGENHIDNMWPAHRICNNRKGSKAGGTRPKRYRMNRA